MNFPGINQNGFQPAVSSSNEQATPRRSSFRKEDFTIKPKSVDTFSQIDSFKITASKARDQQQNHGFQTGQTPPQHWQHYDQYQQSQPQHMRPQPPYPPVNVMSQQSYSIPVQQNPVSQIPPFQASYFPASLPGQGPLPGQGFAPLYSTGTNMQPAVATAPGMYQTAYGLPNSAPFQTANALNTTSEQFATSFTQNDAFSEFEGFKSNPVQNVTLGATGVNDDDFEDFTEFVANNNSALAAPTGGAAEDDFQDFKSCNAVIPKLTESSQMSEKIDPPNLVVEQSTDNATDTPSLSQCLAGKRISIIVKDKSGQTTASSASKSTTVHKPSLPQQIVNKSQKVVRPGLGDLAQTLANASSQLSIVKPPPEEEQKDFNILQEVVSSAEQSRWSPIVKNPESFDLPDTPTKLNQMFPKCTPKRSSSPDDSFADFTTAVSTSDQIVSPPQQPHQPVTVSNDKSASLALGNDADEFDEFADFASVEVAPSGVSSNPVGAPSENMATSNDSTVNKPKVKGHAADWSAITSLDELRTTEADDLGDFSVFGTTLNKITKDTPINEPFDIMNSSPDMGLVQGVMSTLDNNAEETKGDWAEFGTSQSAAEAEEWADFAEPEPVSTNPNTITSTAFQDFQPFEQTSKFEINSVNFEVSDAISGDRQSPAKVDERQSSVDHDSGSDWSGFAVSAQIHADNTSSDLSFKESMSNDIKFSSENPVNSSEPVGTGLPSSYDWISEVSNDIGQLPIQQGNSKIEVKLEESSQPDDNWGAFGAVDWTIKSDSNDQDRNLNSSENITTGDSLFDSNQISSGVDDLFDSNRMSSGVDSIFGNTHVSSTAIPQLGDLNIQSSSSNTFDSSLNFECLSGVKNDDELAQEDHHNLPPEIPDDLDLVPDDLALGLRSEIDHDPPPLSDNDFAEWVDFSDSTKKTVDATPDSVAAKSKESTNTPERSGSNTPERSGSPLTFAPPPLTEEDFSPIKSASSTAPQDWYNSFQTRQSRDSNSPEEFSQDRAKSPEEGTSADYGGFSVNPPVTGTSESVTFNSPHDFEGFSTYQSGGLASDMDKKSSDNIDHDELGGFDSSFIERDDLTLTITSSDTSDNPASFAEAGSNSEPYLDIEITHSVVKTDQSEFGGQSVFLPPDVDVMEKPDCDDEYTSEGWEIRPPPVDELETEKFAGNDMNWGFASTTQNEAPISSLDGTAKEEHNDDEDWGFAPPAEMSSDDEDEANGNDDNEAGEYSWGFTADEDNDEQKKDNNSGDWAFSSPQPGDIDSDSDWKFSPPAEPDDSQTADSQAADAQETEKVELSADDDDFGNFSDNDEFQSFDEGQGQPYSQPQPATNLVSNDKITTVLCSIFPSIALNSDTSMAPAECLHEQASNSKLWRALANLDDKTPLQLQWKESGLYSNLMSSLHIPLQSGLQIGSNLQPTKIYASGSNTLSPTVMKPSKPVGADGAQSSLSLNEKKPADAHSKSSTIDLDFIQDFGASVPGNTASKSSSQATFNINERFTGSHYNDYKITQVCSTSSSLINC